MGIKPRKDEKNKFSIGKICIISTIGVVIFFALLASFSVFALKNGINQSSYLPVGLISGGLSGFIVGFIVVRPVKSKGIVYGALTGFIQALFCSVILFIANNATAGTGIFILSGINILFASLGGITAVNLKFKKKY